MKTDYSEMSAQALSMIVPGTPTLLSQKDRNMAGG
jgi:hypothetical protein